MGISAAARQASQDQADRLRESGNYCDAESFIPEAPFQSASCLLLSPHAMRFNASREHVGFDPPAGEVEAAPAAEGERRMRERMRSRDRAAGARMRDG